jgi:hypothetical protein
MSKLFPTTPLCRKVTSTSSLVEPSTAPVTGRSELDGSAAAMAVATSSALSPLDTATVTRSPPRYSAIVPSAVAGPVVVIVPAAAVPAPLSSSTPMYTSVKVLAANHAIAMR